MQTHHDTAVVQGTTSIVAAYAAANKSSPEEITKLTQDLMQVLGQVGAAGGSITSSAGEGKTQAYAGVLDAAQGSAEGEEASADASGQTSGEAATAEGQTPDTSAASEVADATSQVAEAGMLAVDRPQRGRGRGGRGKSAVNTPAEPAKAEAATPAPAAKTAGRRGRKASATAALDFAAPAGNGALEGEIILPSKPVVPVEGSIEPDTITCLICGNKYRLLALHLDKKHSITFAEYKERFDLDDDYPSAAESYRLGAAEKAKVQGFADQSREVRNGRAAHSQTAEAIKKRNQRAKKAAAKLALKEKERQRQEKLEARRRGQATSGRTRKAAANAA